jgi:Ca2+-binding EF-hand superfamily protein
MNAGAKNPGEGNRLDETDLNYIKENTNLSLKAILDYYKRFVSKYNNGCVNREQFIDIIKRLFIENSAARDQNANNDDHLLKEKLSMSERVFDICDQDDDGFIDFKEYLVLFWTRVNGSLAEKLSLIFDMYDLNSSGYIDFHELHSIVKVLFKLKYSSVEEEENFAVSGVLNSSLPSTYHIAMAIMKKFDLNKNAKLSKEEFINGCLTHQNIKSFLTPLKVF